MSEDIEKSELIKKSLMQIQKLKKELAKKDEAIAIIGMGCRFPGGSSNPEAYWEFLKKGGDGIIEAPGNRWNVEGFYDPDSSVPGKMITKLAGFLEGDVADFDSAFFNISPREAEYMDPQHRLLLEVSYEALESAGIPPSQLEGSLTAVFMGISNHDYMDRIIGTGNKALINPYMAIGNAANAGVGRVSFFFGLQGSNMAVDTACSSSLVAIDEGCRLLRSGESSLVLAGGVNLILSPDLSINFSKAGMLAPDGHCKTFDASADGYARGEGCGVIVLKRLSDALRDHDNILALIKASGVNQGGASSRLTAPNGAAQEALLRSVLDKAKLTGAEVDYIEAHGTGTSLGDPIEARAIGAVYGQRDSSNPLKLASVKTNMGHLEAAAGVAGVIKVVLSLQHEALPAHLHFTKLNPLIELDFPVEIITENKPWLRGERIRRAGVSSFGFSGTNAHIILEEAPISSQEKKPEIRSHHIMALSAKSEISLVKLISAYTEYLKSTSNTIEDIAYTANTGRDHFDYRVAIIAKDKEELLLKLKNRDFLKGEIQDGKKVKVTIQYVDSGAHRIQEEGSTIKIQAGPETDWPTLLNLLGGYYVQGAEVDWRAYEAPFSRKKVLLPAYPFDRKRYWLEL